MQFRKGEFLNGDGNKLFVDVICSGSEFQRDEGRLRGLTSSVLDHSSLLPEFESRRGHILRVFYL